MTSVSSISSLRRKINRTAQAALDVVLPPRCLACGEQVGAPAGLCAACWQGLDLISQPFCACCGIPFEFEDIGGGEGVVCGECTRRRPDFEHARAVMLYAEASRDLVLKLKRGDRTDAAPAFAAWMARAGGALLDEADLIAPVPLHRSRLFGRRFNQSALLANALGRRTGLPVIPNLLVRVRPTPSQGGLTRLGRWRNVQGAFALRSGFEPTIEGRRVLLVDDVLTTGATAESCTRTLKRAGAEAVDVLALARVAGPSQGSI
jgi:ComF family protein